MIPLPVIIAELIMALGGALFGANALVLIKSRSDSQSAAAAGRPAPQIARGKITVMMLVGLVVFTWGLATFIVKMRG
ncbi:MAG: hypothetical protein ABR548_01140 [Actinomycetota bacterium]|nr:hypothetical protein [Actinomycetota bacterium]